MKRTLMALAGVLAMASGAEARNYETIRVGVDSPYPPFEFTNPDGSLGGFEIELGNEVCKEITKKPCDWVVQAWDGIIPGLQSRKYDMIFSSMTISEERKKHVLFSAPYYLSPSGYFAPKASKFSPKSTKDVRIGVQRATVQDKYATEVHKDAKIVRYTSADDLRVDMAGGRLDAVFIEAPVGVDLFKESKKDVVLIGESISEPKEFFGDGIGAAFRKRDKDLAEKVNKALEKLKNDGTYDAIMKKYFDYSIKV